jgi:TonB family protein
MAIGGLIKQKSSEDVRRVPGFSTIPILGFLFRQKTSTIGGGTGERGNTELFIMLTPTIINQKSDVSLKPVTGEIKFEPVDRLVEENLATPLGKYTSVVKKRILDNLTYPPLAKESGFQGKLKLRLLLSYRGELLEAKIEGSSGYNILDENSLKVAKEISLYPPFPEAIKEKELWIDIPIVYRLN